MNDDFKTQPSQISYYNRRGILNERLTGLWYFTTDGAHVKLLQTNERTFYVENVEGKKFHVLHEELVMHHESIPETLRKKPAATPFVNVYVKHIPEHYDIRINGTSIDKYSDEELFGWIQDIETEMAELEKITNRPIALAKLLDDKRRSINNIIAWMNARK